MLRATRSIWWMTVACLGIAGIAGARDTAPDTWAGTDALGRSMPMGGQVRAPRDDRFVAMFYFLWHDASERLGPFDVTRILDAHPDAMRHDTSPPWGPVGAMHYWGEPLFGYYLEDDPWVLRKHAQMLSDAGVDVIVFDASNRLTYRRNYTALMETYRQIRRAGGRTPAVAFLTPFGDPRSTVHELYEQLYARHLYEELWFRWDGRPLILADPAKVDADARASFTFRRPQPDYFRGPAGPDMWSWLEIYPQHVFRNARGEKEQMSVGVAQNAVGGRVGSMSEPGARGRSFHSTQPAATTQPADVRLGLNVAEQWERALREDPGVVFVTGWNEWVAGRFEAFNGVRTPPMFVDEFDEEHSRDIEPMRGGHGDDYYMQLASYVRRFKGARPAPTASAPKTIHIADDFSQWDDVRPEYQDDLFDSAHRDHAGFATAGPYRDDSGRNDLDTMKVARDRQNVYFYVRTREPITAPAGDNWMVLFIDADQDHATGWEGYDFVVNRHRASDDTCTLERNLGGWKWEKVADIRSRHAGNQLHLAIPLKLLGIRDQRVAMDFKWADNVPLNGDILEFYQRGDVAPNGRLNYRFGP